MVGTWCHLYTRAESYILIYRQWGRGRRKRGKEMEGRISLGLAWAFETLKSSPNDPPPNKATPPSIRPYLLIHLKQFFNWGLRM